MTAGGTAEARWHEDALAEPVVAPRWRLWHYDAAEIVLGCSQRAWWSERDAGVPMRVRSSGGGAVLVGPWMIGLSAVLPPAHQRVAAGLVPSYRWLGEAIAAALQQIGVGAGALPPAALAAGRGAAGPDWACFGSLSPWEVVVGGRKIAGLAQTRRRHGVLLVTGVLLAPPPWALLSAALGRPPADALQLANATTSCAEQLPAAEPAALAERLTRSLSAAVEQALS